MSITLDQFFDRLDQYEAHIPLDDLKEGLADLQFTAEDAEEWTRFNAEGYTRNLIHTGSGYEALLLCWASGQRSPIHDHRGSACGVLVVRGTVTETVFKHTERGWVYATESHELGEGGACGSNDMDTHQLSNLQADGEDLITLHIYSPPLDEMGIYSIEDNRVTRIKNPRDAPLVVA